MFEKLVPVNRERHAGKKMRDVTGFEFASKFHIVYLTTHEFARAAATYPIVFVEDKEKDTFRPVALLGLEQGENLYVDASGKWEASYVPAIVRRHPFMLADAGVPGQFTICVDEGSELLSDTDGSPMFDDNGAPTQVIENVKRYLSELQQLDALTHEFTKSMTELNMLTPLSLRVRESGDRVKNIAGCWVINEERLNGLSNERFQELRAKRWLPAIYAQLISLGQIERLTALKDKRSAAGAVAAAATAVAGAGATAD